jgi:membrane protease YdiL (CAAX protease family)
MRIRGCLLRPNRPAWLAGPNGLRATWRVLIFTLLVVLQLILLAIAAVFTMKLLHVPKTPHAVFSPHFVFFNEFLLLLPVLGATAAMAFLEDAPFLGYGLAGPAKYRNLLTGYATGLAALSLLVATLIATHSGIITQGGFGPLADLRYGLEWCAITLLIGFTEELTFRGYIFSTINRGAGPLWATLITSVCFAAAHGHNAGETFIGLVDILEAGLVFGYAIHLTKSLWWGIGLHGAWDFCENYLYGTRDSGTACYGTLLSLAPHGNVYLSGGLTGPEGSVFSLLMIGLIALAVFARFRA